MKCKCFSADMGYHLDACEFSTVGKQDSVIGRKYTYETIIEQELQDHFLDVIPVYFMVKRNQKGDFDLICIDKVQGSHVYLDDVNPLISKKVKEIVKNINYENNINIRYNDFF